jgi:hypothetical protein
MAPPSGSNRTERWADHGLFVFCRRSSSSSHRFQFINAFSCREKAPEAKIGGSWRHPAVVTRPNDRLTPVSYCWSCSVDIARPALTVFDVITFFRVMEMNRKQNQWYLVPPSESIATNQSVSRRLV